MASYTETTTQRVVYDKTDILSWAKTFAARQMGIDTANLKDEDIIISNEDITITVTCVRESFSKKDEE